MVLRHKNFVREKLLQTRIILHPLFLLQKATLFKEPPPYERLVGNLSGFYSRRINIQHRVVYEVYVQETYEDGVEYEGIVKVARMWTHYDGMR